MNRKERIQAILEKELNPNTLEISDESAKHAGHAGASANGETHYNLKIASGIFLGKTILEQQRLVNALLKDEFASGLHALSMNTQAPVAHLISFILCPYVQRCVLLLNHKKIPFEITYIDLSNKPDWFLKISPLGKVPVLQVGNHILFESLFILEYLDTVYAPQILSPEPILAAKEKAWMEFLSQTYMDQYFLSNAKTKEDVEKHKTSLHTKLQRIEEIIPLPYFQGAILSLLDIGIAPLVQRLKILNKLDGSILPSGKFPKLETLYSTLHKTLDVDKAVVPNFEEEYIANQKKNGSVLVS